MRSGVQQVNLRAAMFPLLEQGLSISAVARQVGVPRSTAQRIAEEWRIQCGGKLAAGRRTNGYELSARQPALAERDRLQRQYAEHYANPNVAIFGDPPLYRSALWAKIHGQ